MGCNGCEKKNLKAIKETSLICSPDFAFKTDKPKKNILKNIKKILQHILLPRSYQNLTKESLL